MLISRVWVGVVVTVQCIQVAIPANKSSKAIERSTRPASPSPHSNGSRFRERRSDGPFEEPAVR
jgi:hypothetical protein